MAEAAEKIGPVRRRRSEPQAPRPDPQPVALDGAAGGAGRGRAALLLVRLEDAAGRLVLRLPGCGSTSGCS